MFGGFEDSPDFNTASQCIFETEKEHEEKEDDNLTL
jgi:hypothetical protein